MSNKEWEYKPGQQCLVICESVTEVLNPPKKRSQIFLQNVCVYILYSLEKLIQHYSLTFMPYFMRI